MTPDTPAKLSTRFMQLPVTETFNSPLLSIPTNTSDGSTTAASVPTYGIFDPASQYWKREDSYGLGALELAAIHAEGEVIGSLGALSLLMALVDRRELTIPELDVEQLSSAILLASSGMLFEADARIFPTTRGIRLMEDIMRRFSDA